MGQTPPDPGKPATEVIRPVTVCEILADPEAFDGKTVALLGALTTGPESLYMVED